MQVTDKKKTYDVQYKKDKIKRIPLDVQKEKYEEIVKASLEAGESVNGYINRLIDSDLKNYTIPCSNSKGRTDRE